MSYTSSHDTQYIALLSTTTFTTHLNINTYDYIYTLLHAYEELNQHSTRIDFQPALLSNGFLEQPGKDHRQKMKERAQVQIMKTDIFSPFFRSIFSDGLEFRRMARLTRAKKRRRGRLHALPDPTRSLPHMYQ